MVLQYGLSLIPPQSGVGSSVTSQLQGLEFDPELGLPSVWSFIWFPCGCVGFLQPPKTSDSKLLLRVNDCVCVCGVLRRTGIPFRVYSCPAPSVSGTGSGSSVTLSRIHSLLKINE